MATSNIQSTPEAFMVAFGSALALHREKDQLFVVTSDGQKRPISIAQAQLIGDDFHRAAKACEYWRQDSGRPIGDPTP